jgi:hypothetical protein
MIGGLLVVVEGLIFVGGEHPEAAVTTLSIVEDLDVLEDRVSESLRRRSIGDGRSMVG